MRDYITIGPSPYDEQCIQLGKENYDKISRIECQAFINQIRRELGNEPDGAKLSIKSFPHEYGNYREVVCYYDDNLPESIDYAFKCESDSPQNWDKESLKILGK